MKNMHFLILIMVLMMIGGCNPVVRFDIEKDREQVEEILNDLDNLTLSAEEQLENYVSGAVILAPDQVEIRGEEALFQHLSEFGAGVDLSIRHDVVELTSFEDIVVVQGRVVGTAQPDNDSQTYPFETKNIILFKRGKADELKIWKVIYNSSPVSS